MISLEFVEQMQDVGDEDLVAFVSLLRWTYLCQPPMLVNFIDCAFSLHFILLDKGVS
jgi:hypothetical protein